MNNTTDNLRAVALPGLGMRSELPKTPQYRLVLSNPFWPRPVRTKWQATKDFGNALAKAAEMGVTASIETSHTGGSAFSG